MTQARPDRLCLLDRQLELAQPPPTLDPEQVAHRRLALQPTHEHGVDLVLRARARTHQLLTPRQAPAHPARPFIRRPDRIQLARREQPRERPRVQPVCLRARPPDPRIRRAHHDDPGDVRLEDPRDLPRAPGHLQRHPILPAKTRGEQLKPLRRRLDATRRAHHTSLRDRDLAEIAMHIQPDRSADRSHLVLLSTVDLTENQRANDNDRYVLTAHPGKSQGRPPRMLGLEAHRPQTACPAAFSQNAPVPGDRP